MTTSPLAQPLAQAAPQEPRAQPLAQHVARWALAGIEELDGPSWFVGVRFHSELKSVRFERMRYLIQIAICTLLFSCAQMPAKDVTQDPFLHPYVQQLKKTTSADDLRRITAMSKSQLILLLHGYGTGIRNRWIHGDRDPKLVRFFRSNGIKDPEEASMVIIEALWHDLNRHLTIAERAAIDAKRTLVARKRATYERLESECATQLTKAQDKFERSYTSHGPPSKNPVSRDPFFKLLVGRSGHVREIIFFEGASPELKASLSEILNGFTFSSFADDEFVTLYTIEHPSFCRVAERDTLHD